MWTFFWESANNLHATLNSNKNNNTLTSTIETIETSLKSNNLDLNAFNNNINLSKLFSDLNLIKSIQTLNDDGRARAFIRQSLRSKKLSYYIEMLYQNRSLVLQYYWDFSIVSNQSQFMQLIAQLGELDYLSKNCEIQMLLNDQKLNILQYFKNENLTKDGKLTIPIWNIIINKNEIINDNVNNNNNNINNNNSKKKNKNRNKNKKIKKNRSVKK